MKPNADVSLLLIVFSLAFSLLLMMIPLPAIAATARPAFLPATVLFWALMQPRRFGVMSAWLVGLFMDASYTTPLGQHALALACAAFVIYRMKRFLWDFPVFQQSLFMLPVLALYEFILFWIDGVNGRSVDLVWRWLPVLSTALIWPFWSLLLERFAHMEVKN